MVAELTRDQGADDRADISDGEEIADIAHPERIGLRNERRDEGRHDRVVAVDFIAMMKQMSATAWGLTVATDPMPAAAAGA